MVDVPIFAPVPLTRIRELAEAILQQRLAEFGFSGLSAMESVDSDGTSVVVLRARYNGTREPSPTKALDAEVAIQRALYALGDDRTIHLFHELPGDDMDAE